MTKKDLTNKKFGRLLVIEEDRIKGGSFWICKCSCGKLKSVYAGNLNSGSVQSCGCLQIENSTIAAKNRREDLTGCVFNRLTVIGRDETKNRVYWNCECVCGNKISVRADGLKSGDVQSCKCLNREITSELCKSTNTTHGLSKNRFYKIYLDIKSRCCNKEYIEYKNYGARGIKLADYWLNDIYGFIDYVSSLEHSDNPELSIDRIDNNGNYEIGNLRWATKEEQAQNCRRTKLNPEKVREIRKLVETVDKHELASKFNIAYSTLIAVINLRTWKNVI